MNLLFSKRTIFIFHLLLFVQLVLISLYVFHPVLFPPEGKRHLIVVGDLFYPNIIQQSKDGAWRIIESHTTIFTPRIFAYTFYVILGKLSAVFSLDPPWVFLYAKILFGVVYFYITAWFVTNIIPKQHHLLAIFLALGLESGPFLGRLPNLEVLWDARVSFLRNFGLPHHRFAHATGLIFIFALLLLTKNVTRKRLTVLVVSGLISAISMPGYLFTFAFSVFPIWSIWAVLTRTAKRIIPLLIAAGMIIVIPNLIFMFEFKKGPPWVDSTAVERQWLSTKEVNGEYFSSLLLYMPLFLVFGIIFPNLYRQSDRWKKQLMIVLVSWLVSPLFWTYIAEFSWFPMPDHRLTDSHGYIPAALLATMAFMHLWQAKKQRGVIAILCIITTIIPSCLLSVYFAKQKFDNRNAYYGKFMYVSENVWNGMMYLKTLPKGSGIMVRESFGDILPMYASIRTYVGGPYNYWDYESRKRFAGMFFIGDIVDVRNFLKYNDISYVFFGPDEKAINYTGTLYEDSLTVIYQNPEVTIFKLNTE